MRDPVQTYVAQPLVDVLQIDPKGSAVVMADAFLMAVLTLSAVRIVTLDPATNPGLHLWQTLHVVGGVIVHAWMRFCAVNGAVARTGAMGTLHVGMRAVFATCMVIDARDLHLLVTTAAGLTAAGLARPLLQLTENVLAAASLYLSLCDTPPPRPRRPRTARAYA